MQSNKNETVEMKVCTECGTLIHPYLGHVCEGPKGAKEEQSALDVQHGGDHYKTKGIQPIEYILANQLGFCEGNVVKYVTRYKDKNGLEDLKKAKHYLEFLMEELEKEQNV